MSNITNDGLTQDGL